LQETIELLNAEEERGLLGREDRNLRALRRALGVRIIARKGRVVLDGAPDKLAAGKRVVTQLLDQVRKHGHVVEEDVESIVRANGLDASMFGLDEQRIVRALDGTDIVPRTEGQAAYVKAMRANDMVFAIGPAGTGKTYLAVAVAISCMKRGLFRKLVLVRPALEAGERLGFLPGDLVEKVSPYLRPLYDALGDIVPFSEVKSYRERDIIEVVPLAFMRGRTLDNAFIILDEGQNTTRSQMKMFLTRMGRHSKVVVTGDVTQTDLARGQKSGLVDAHEKLQGIAGITFCRLGRADIVRHPLVQRIVDAYEDPLSTPLLSDQLDGQDVEETETQENGQA